MTTLLLQQIITTAINALPRLFLFGAPILAIVMTIAALADTRGPWSTDHAVPAPPPRGRRVPRRR